MVDVSRNENDAVQITIDNQTGVELGISHASLSSGKFHKGGSKSTILTNATINAMTITNNTVESIFSCGHASASVGTEGSFIITADADNTIVRKIEWDCPYSGNNKFKSTEGPSAWRVDQHGGTNTGGALGLVYLKVSKY